MKKLFILFILLNFNYLVKSQTTPNDGDWKSNFVYLENTDEADVMIRIGDMDNLNFGWPANFNPFCGKSTPNHKYPWQANNQDIPGMDRILLGSSFIGKKGTDGYSSALSPETKPVPILIPIKKLKGKEIREIKMQVFIDDFQSFTHGSNFKVSLNGKRFINMEKLLKMIDQTGPVGRVITVEVNGGLLPEFAKDSVLFFIDDPTTGLGDGYAVDFIKLLINPKALIYKGDIKGKVKNTKEQPFDSVEITIPGSEPMLTKADGTFEFKDVQTGLLVLKAYKKGYTISTKNVIVECSKTALVNIIFYPSKKLVFNGKEILEGDDLNLSNFQFSAGSSDLSPTAKSELDLIFNFLNSNRNVEIELNGHTSSEGDAGINRELSLLRVDASKTYLEKKGIDGRRIFTAGYGPDRPIAPNDTEENRAKNRRVEMIITKIK